MKITLLIALASIAAVSAWAQDRGSKRMDRSANVKSVMRETRDDNSQYKDKNGVYTYVNQMPEPTFNINEYLQNNLTYPVEAMKLNKEGRAKVKFVVDDKGMITNVEAITNLGYGLEEEVIRLVKNMPKWNPGIQDGKPVSVYFTLPVSFRLSNDD